MLSLRKLEGDTMYRIKNTLMLLLVVWEATLIASVNILKNKPAKLFNMS